MLTRDEAAQLWGELGILRVPDEALEDLHLPARSKRFLREVGLPKEGPLLVTFELVDGTFPRLREYAEVEGFEISGAARYRRVGSDYGTELCLDESNFGAVVGIDLDSRGKKTWISAGIELFVEGLYLYARHSEEAMESRDRRAEQFEQQLQERDPLAFTHPDNWWPAIVEQMRDDLL